MNISAKKTINISVLTISDTRTEATDKSGQIEIETHESGRFILSSIHTVDKNVMYSGKQVNSLMYISTLGYVAP